jgi:hypothetical protein
MIMAAIVVLSFPFTTLYKRLKSLADSEILDLSWDIKRHHTVSLRLQLFACILLNQGPQLLNRRTVLLVISQTHANEILQLFAIHAGSFIWRLARHESVLLGAQGIAFVALAVDKELSSRALVVVEWLLILAVSSRKVHDEIPHNLTNAKYVGLARDFLQGSWAGLVGVIVAPKLLHK